MIETLARLGYAAKGIVYATVGLLAIQTAVGSGGKTTGSQGALQSIANQPFGQILLVIVGVGLFGYAIWRLVEAFIDAEHKGDDASGIGKRLGYAASGIIYGFLGVQACLILFGYGGGSGGSGGSSTRQDWTAWLLAQPFGRWLVGLVGALVIGFGFYQFYKAYQAKFRKQQKLSEMSRKEEKWSLRIGRFGLAARGVVLVITGGFFIQAAKQSDASEAQGLAAALNTLARQPFGPWLLGIVAIGLIAYGVHMLVQARYRRIPA